jgi:pimeloyl-ACP methyl ester carboxylesterase
MPSKVVRLLSLVLTLLLLVPPAEASAGSSLTIVEIGGIGTDATPGAPWSLLEPYLSGAVSFRRFQYDTCGDITANVHQLTTFVQAMRPSRVILAGHSLGGVLALSAAADSDLSGLVQAVVVADAPVNGLDPDLVSFGQSLGVVPYPCLALDQLEDTSSATAAQKALAQGIGLLDISNAYDNLVPITAQELPQDVNLRFDVRNGSGFVNHTAVFESVAALNAIAQFIRTR